MIKETDLYVLMGVEVTATEKEIKTAYRKLALKYHPDKNKEKSAEDIFKAVAAAYTVLSDKVSNDEFVALRKRKLLRSCIFSYTVFSCQVTRYRYDLSRPSTNLFRRGR